MKSKWVFCNARICSVHVRVGSCIEVDAWELTMVLAIYIGNKKGRNGPAESSCSLVKNCNVSVGGPVTSEPRF